MENHFEKIKKYLTDNNIGFEELTHEPAASALEYQQTLHTQLEQQAKALLIKYKLNDQKKFAIVTLQAQKKADFEQITKLLNTDTVKLAARDELKKLTGCNFGELPPLGSPFGLPLLMDTDLLNEEKIYFNCCRLDKSLTMNPNDLKQIEKPLLF